MLNIPSGPSTSTICGGSALVIAFLVGGGSRRRRLTSGGIDNGAPPIRDLHREEHEKKRVVGVATKAGRRKSGTSIDLLESVTILRAAVRMGDSILGTDLLNNRITLLKLKLICQVLS